jgi:glycerate dehydrogenase
MNQKKTNIVVLDGYTLNPGDLSWEEVAQLGKLTVYDRTLPDEVVVRVKEAAAIFTNKVVITKEVISRLPHLKYIGVLATGYNVVDISAATEAGIAVTNIPAYSTGSVAQLVFGHILNYTNRIEFHANEVKDGKWSANRDFCFWSTQQTELAGKTMGIIGFGKIGQAIAKIGYAFGMRIIFYSPSLKTGLPDWIHQRGLEAIFRESDFVSINCPLTSDNQGFVNKSLLSLMKPAAFLINTGRGLLVNENDLAEALNNGMIAGAGLDVLSTEPPSPENPLLTAKNCYITPHIAWATFEARSRLIKIAAGNLRAYLSGNPVNTVNNIMKS